MGRPPLASVLVVDDDPAHRLMLRTMLEGWGYRVSEADDGQKAVEYIREEPFDLVLMDLRMPKLSGIEATKAICRYNPDSLFLHSFSGGSPQGRSLRLPDQAPGLRRFEADHESGPRTHAASTGK